MDYNVYEQMYNVFKSKTIINAAESLKKFADIALQEKNYANLVKSFYESAISFKHVYDDLFELTYEKREYVKIVNEQDPLVIGWYISINMPSMTTPKKTLNKLREYAEELISHFNLGNHNILNKNDAEYIISILDKEYDFSRIVSNDYATVICILDVVKEDNKEDGTTLITRNIVTGKVKYVIFLYQLKEFKSDTYVENCKAVLLHELGHVVHSKHCGTSEWHVPYNIQMVLDESCFPGFKTLSIEEQNEILADVLSMGMVYGNELDVYDPFIKIAVEHKKLFHDIFINMIKDIRDSLSVEKIESMGTDLKNIR